MASKSISQPGNGASVKSRFSPSELPLSELSLLLNGELRLNVPVYTVWGACEDVRVLEKFRSREYKVPNLHIIDEAQSMLLEVGGVKLRLLGLGGAVVMHKLFDNGEGRTTIAGGQGTMWTTLLQMGELVDTANRVYDPTETRVFITHASPAREGILNQLSVTLKADFSISAGLHFRYGSSYNEFSVNPTLDHYRGKLAASKASFNDVWETVKGEVEPAIQQNEAQQNLLKNAISIVEKMPTTAAGGNPFGSAGGPPALGQVDESAFKNMWNFNLADAAFGFLVLEIQDGRIGTEMRAQGFNFSHRGMKQQGNAPQQVPAPAAASTASPQPVVATLPPTQPQQQSQTQAILPQSQSVIQQQQQSTSGKAEPGKLTASNPGSGPAKSATPQPPSLPSRKDLDKPSVSTNGTVNGPESIPSPAPRGSAQDVIGLFIMNAQPDDQTRELFADEDVARIVKIEKYGQTNKVVHFRTVEDRDGAMARLPEEAKHRATEDRSRPLGRAGIEVLGVGLEQPVTAKVLAGAAAGGMQGAAEGPVVEVRVEDPVAEEVQEALALAKQMEAAHPRRPRLLLQQSREQSALYGWHELSVKNMQLYLDSFRSAPCGCLMVSV
ncbi:serine/threonine-protein phosphatase family protein [Grosmannia clavigera kw1407]|uniref:Serine/threonine-protein phosphatase family protein n=1 Tax=Grosmannia clavigera (strain kw1407 / UAMH 11150) TaxID=655863 RepID=F0X9F4_GROCL|nr:serine/threonine-protein phosphatase family protein [Grosmannia clavigera kw1407]EFX05989.1 serine/threonine-protein phosphatase family protein [Grosmannia clavigera kw1407]